MAWQNAFALGACVVEVWTNRVTGEFQLVPPSEYEENEITVSVSDAGLVTMTAPSIGGSGAQYEVRVVPSYSTQGRAVRLAIAETPDEPADFNSPQWSAGPTGVDPFEGFDRPFEFTPKGPWVWAGYNAGRQGI